MFSTLYGRYVVDLTLVNDARAVCGEMLPLIRLCAGITCRLVRVVNYGLQITCGNITYEVIRRGSVVRLRITRSLSAFMEPL